VLCGWMPCTGVEVGNFGRRHTGRSETAKRGVVKEQNSSAIVGGRGRTAVTGLNGESIQAFQVCFFFFTFGTFLSLRISCCLCLIFVELVDGSVKGRLLVRLCACLFFPFVDGDLRTPSILDSGMAEDKDGRLILGLAGF